DWVLRKTQVPAAVGVDRHSAREDLVADAAADVEGSASSQVAVAIDRERSRGEGWSPVQISREAESPEPCDTMLGARVGVLCEKVLRDAQDDESRDAGKNGEEMTLHDVLLLLVIPAAPRWGS